MAEALAERARAEAEQRKREQEAEAERVRRELEAKRRREEKLEAQRQYQRAQSRDLRGLARRWAGAAQVRAFLGAVEDAVPVPHRDERFLAWFQWASKKKRHG